MQRSWLKQWFLYLAVALLMLVAIFPFYYMVITSFKGGTGIFIVDYFPTEIRWDNYRGLFGEDSYFGQNILNSLVVATAVSVLSLFLGLTAAFALARIRFRGRAVLLVVILSTSMFPQVSVLAGLFELVTALKLFNSLFSLIFSYMIFSIPFTVWVLTTFMKELPIELEHAALVDGASTATLIFRVFLPLLWPALISTGLLTFIAAWNEFLFALTFISSGETRTVPVAIALLSGTTEREIPWGNIMAASVVVTAPLIALVLFFQKKIISGLTAGAVKG